MSELYVRAVFESQWFVSLKQGSHPWPGEYLVSLNFMDGTGVVCIHNVNWMEAVKEAAIILKRRAA